MSSSRLSSRASRRAGVRSVFWRAISIFVILAEISRAAVMSAEVIIGWCCGEIISNQFNQMQGVVHFYQKPNVYAGQIASPLAGFCGLSSLGACPRAPLVSGGLWRASGALWRGGATLGSLEGSRGLCGASGGLEPPSGRKPRVSGSPMPRNEKKLE